MLQQIYLPNKTEQQSGGLIKARSRGDWDDWDDWGGAAERRGEERRGAASGSGAEEPERSMKSLIIRVFLG